MDYIVPLDILNEAFLLRLLINWLSNYSISFSSSVMAPPKQLNIYIGSNLKNKANGIVPNPKTIQIKCSLKVKWEHFIDSPPY